MEQKETKDPAKRSQGAVLLLTTILLFVILGMVVSLTYVTVMEQKMSGKTKSSVGSFYNSESGIEWALNKIANNSGTINSALTGLTTYNDGKIDCPFPGNSCSVYFLGADGKVIKKTDFGKNISEVKAVRSVGSQGGDTQRAIEAAVAGTGGGCYIDYSFTTPLAVGSPCKISGFTNKGSAGKWGSSASGNTGADHSCPAGGPCTTILGEAWVCCQSAGGSGACYVSYSSNCLTGFTDKGSIGKWGGCDLGYDGSLHNYIFRPAGGTCGSWTSFDSGEEHVCCL